jgi:MFS family permease
MGGIGLLFVLLGGYFLDWYIEMFPANNQYHAFHILFGIAILFGLISTFLLMKQSEFYKPSPVRYSYRFLFKKPLSNQNFMKLIRFGIFWSFSFNIAAPFFIVFMLHDLKLSYTLVAGYTITSSCLDLLGMWIWGYISDRTSNKPVIVISGTILALLPLAWLLVDSNPLSIFFLIPLLHLTAGFFQAGYNLCSMNLVLRVAPSEHNSVYLSYWSGFTVITTGLGALLGGYLARISLPLAAPSLLIFNTSYKYIFFISSILRIGSIFFLKGFREPQGVAVVKVIESLRAIQSWIPLWFFIPQAQPEKLRSPYWPIWKTKS